MSKKDKADPCAVCGWAEHMAIHLPPADHAYVSESVMRNPMDKPAPSASVFARAAWFLADYAELWFDSGPHEGEAEIRENYARCMEKIELARRLLEMDVAQQRFTAEIVKDIPAIPVFLKG